MKYLKRKKLILSSLDNTFDATMVIAQHLGEAFMPSFIKRMSLTCKQKDEAFFTIYFKINIKR